MHACAPYHTNPAFTCGQSPKAPKLFIAIGNIDIAVLESVYEVLNYITQQHGVAHACNSLPNAAQPTLP